MSRTYSNKTLKIHNGEYLIHKDEPIDEIYHDQAGTELDVDLVRSSYYERSRLRHMAKRLRNSV